MYKNYYKNRSNLLLLTKIIMNLVITLLYKNITINNLLKGMGDYILKKE